MILTSKHTIQFSNTNKKNTINDFIDEYRRVSSIILNDLHNKKSIPYTVESDIVVQLHYDFLQDIVLLEDNQYSTEILKLYSKAAIENEYK